MATILAREATVKTAVVEIKSLTVSGKQVTLALFRQFQEEWLLLPETLEKRGVLWGRVNYHFGGCEEAGDHLHIVWQKRDELRRCQVNRSCAQVVDQYQRELNRYARAAAAQMMRTQPFARRPARAGCGHPFRNEVIVGGLVCGWPSVSPSIESVDRHRSDGYRRPAEFEQHVRALIQDGYLPGDLDDLEVADWQRMANESQTAINTIRTGWDGLYFELSRLEQLFIAT